MTTPSDNPADFTLRDAAPDDAEFLARVIQMASVGKGSSSVWDLALGPDQAEQLLFLKGLVLAEPACAAHFGGFVVAESEARPIAGACGLIPSEKSPEKFTEALLSVAETLGWSETRQLKLIGSFDVFARCLPMTRSENWVLEYIATLPEYRGQGVNQELLGDLLDCGRESGAKTAQVAYFVGNTPAMKLYRKLGFRETHELLDKDFEKLFGAAGVVHMTLQL